MDYIRTTIQIDSLNGIIPIPSNFKSKEVEIFIFPKEKRMKANPKRNSKKIDKNQTKKLKKDSIFLLGKNPVIDKLNDGSINHDSYIYV